MPIPLFLGSFGWLPPARERLVVGLLSWFWLEFIVREVAFLSKVSQVLFVFIILD